MTRVLIVDDEASIVRGLAYALEREEYEVEVAVDGESAVEKALSQPFDLIVLDLMLPLVPGEEVCRRIRAKSDVPIIMLTAKDAERDIVAGLEIGADDYVTKPFSAAELLGRMGALLRRRELDRAASRNAARVVGDVRIDLVHDEVEVSGQKVQLTPSEFKILKLLTEEPGRVYSRQEIMEQLWGSNFVGDAHTCQVHISALRRKIEVDCPSAKRLLTVRGAGYMLLPS